MGKYLQAMGTRSRNALGHTYVGALPLAAAAQESSRTHMIYIIIHCRRCCWLFAQKGVSLRRPQLQQTPWRVKFTGLSLPIPGLTTSWNGANCIVPCTCICGNGELQWTFLPSSECAGVLVKKFSIRLFYHGPQRLLPFWLSYLR
jgi:hypothetical protein